MEVPQQDVIHPPKGSIRGLAGVHRPLVFAETVDISQAAYPSHAQTSLIDDLANRTTEIRLGALAEFPNALKSEGAHLTLVRSKDRIIRLALPADRTGAVGLALDLGTTTVGGHLVDLISKSVLASGTTANPQEAFGADVIARIQHAQECGPGGLAELQSILLTAVNRLIQDLCSRAGATKGSVVHAIVVGNPTMLHLFLGVDPYSLGQAPFSPVWKRSLTFSACELALDINPGAIVATLPFISGYVGADIVAGILATRLHQARSPELFVDLGTNGEIVLASRSGMVACATAAGPAFEGGRISCGMPAVRGAISSVDFSGTPQYAVLGAGEPKGVCGSGLIDLLAELLSRGIVNRSGRFVFKDTGSFPGTVARRGNELVFRSLQGRTCFSLRQADVRELQLAIAAVRAGVETLLSLTKTAPKDIRRVHLAGAFGAQLRPSSVVRVGLLPGELLDRTESVGSTAGQGALIALLDQDAFLESERIAGITQPVELSGNAVFTKAFVKHILLPSCTSDRRNSGVQTDHH